MMWLLVFTATVIADFLWAQWAIACNARRAVPASLYSAGILFCSGFTIVEYTHDAVLLIPAALGALVGTWLAVKQVF